MTCVILPNDLQMQAMQEPAHEHGMTHSGVGIDLAPVVPDRMALTRAAGILNAGEKVAMLVGAGALGASEQVIAVAERLGARRGQGPPREGGYARRSSPSARAPSGCVGTKASWEIMQGCDTLLIVGSGFPYAEFLPEPGQARGVQIDINAGMLALRYPTEVNLLGDAAETLRALLPMLEQKSEGRWQRQVREHTKAAHETAHKLAMVDADPINPQRVVYELNKSACPTGRSWLPTAAQPRSGTHSSLRSAVRE